MKRSVLMHHDLADKIRALIQSSALTPGSPLPSERELSSLLSASRPSVRTGLLVLHLNGEIEIERGIASFVRTPRVLLNPGFDGAGPLELLRARVTIESTIASQAALHADIPDIDRLKLLLDEMRSTRCAIMHRSLSRSFHRSLALAAGQHAVADILNLLMNGMSDKPLDLLSDEYLRDCLEAETCEHSAILEAIIAKDAAKAVKSMRDHLFCVEERLRGTIASGASQNDTCEPASPYLFQLSARGQQASIHASSSLSMSRT